MRLVLLLAALLLGSLGCGYKLEVVAKAPTDATTEAPAPAAPAPAPRPPTPEELLKATFAPVRCVRAVIEGSPSIVCKDDKSGALSSHPACEPSTPALKGK